MFGHLPRDKTLAPLRGQAREAALLLLLAGCGASAPGAKPGPTLADSAGPRPTERPDGSTTGSPATETAGGAETGVSSPDDTGPPSASETGAAGETGGPASGQPNFLIFLADDLGVDRMALYGAKGDDVPQTPAIDRLASEGLVFRNFWAQPLCSPTRYELMTGRYAARIGLGNAITWRSDFVIPPETPFLPALLPGYHGAMIGKYHLAAGELGYHDATDRGYDLFTGALGNLGPSNSPTDRFMTYHNWEKVVDAALTRSTRYATTDNAEDAIRQVRELPEPWVVFVAFNAPHAPYHVAPEELWVSDWSDAADTNASRYATMVEAIDTELGRVVDALSRAQGNRTVIAFLGDNGTPGNVLYQPGLKGTTREGGVRVPLVMRGPGVPAGASTDAPVQAVDLVPTWLDLAGAPLPAGLDGESLRPCLDDPAGCAGRELRFAAMMSPNGGQPWRKYSLAAGDGRFKLIESRLCQESTEATYYLFDMSADGEALDLLLSDLAPDAAAALDALQAHLNSVVGEDRLPCGGRLDTGGLSDTGAGLDTGL